MPGDDALAQTQELEESLASALADIEVKRLRVKRLQLENVHLRNLLRTHEIQPGPEVDLESAEERTHRASKDQVSSEHSHGSGVAVASTSKSGEGEYDATIVAGGTEVQCPCAAPPS
jgi:hypothetical protein